jgi:hypothetical protein
MKSGWTNNTLFSAISLVFGTLMLVWGIAYGVANYQSDQCLSAVDDLVTSNQALLTATQARADKDRARQAALNARTTAE